MQATDALDAALPDLGAESGGMAEIRAGKRAPVAAFELRAFWRTRLSVGDLFARLPAGFPFCRRLAGDNRTRERFSPLLPSNPTPSAPLFLDFDPPSNADHSDQRDCSHRGLSAFPYREPRSEAGEFNSSQPQPQSLLISFAEQSTAHELVHALKTVGFVMLKDFNSEEGVTEVQVERAFQHVSRAAPSQARR